MKKSKILIIATIFFTLFLSDCSFKKDNLKISLPHAMFIFDPHQTSWSADCKINSNIFEPLVKLKQNFEVEPLLAHRWYNSSPLIWIFDIRRGIKFHNGEELTAETIKKNFERISKKNLFSPYYQITEKIKEIKVLGKYKILFKLKKRCDDFLILLSDIKIIYLKKKMFSSVKYKKKLFFGTGPFQFYMVSKDYVVLKRFENYWRGKPKFKEIIFSFDVRNKNKIKNFDIAEVFPAFQAKDGFKLIIKPSNYVYFLILNVNRKPFADKYYREIISRKIPYDEILNRLNILNSYRIKQLVPPWLRYSLRNINTEDNKRIECKKFEKNIVFIYRKTNKISEISAKLIYKNLKTCFPGLQFIPVNDREWRKRLFFEKSVDITLFGYSSDTGGVDDLLIKFFHSPTEHKGLLNIFEYRNKELDSLIDRAEKANNYQIKDELYRKAHRMALESKVFIPLFIFPEFLMIKKDLKIKKGVDLRDIFDSF